MIHTCRFNWLAAIPVLLLANSAHAAFTFNTFTDSASFFSAVGSTVTEDFETGNQTNFALFNSTDPDLVADIAYSASGDLYTFDASYGYSGITSMVLFNGDANDLTLTLSPNVTALGFDYITWNTTTNNNSVEIIDDLGGSHLFTVDTTVSNPRYFGIVVTEGSIQSATLTSTTTTIGIDNITFGAAAAVPEPGTPMLMGLALGLLGYRARQKAKASR